MATIFVDEAGYTGSNLLDPAQPVFILSTHDLGETEAVKIKDEFFSSIKSESLKFSQLARRPRSQDAILQFLSAMLQNHANRIGTYVIHKPFALICKLVDVVVEASMHKAGVNLYERGGNLALANALYIVPRDLAGEEYMARLLRATQRLFIGDTLAGAGELTAVLEEQTGLMFGPKSTAAAAKFLEIPQLALLDIGVDYVANLEKRDLLITFSAALVTMSRWEERHSGNLDVVHDESSVMLRQFDEWVNMTAITVPAATVGMDRRTMQFPIGVRSTKFEPDELWAGLQLADLIAGALARAFPHFDKLTNEKPDSFTEKLVAITSAWKLVDSIWPESKFTPEELGTDGPILIDPLAFYAKHFCPKRT